MSEDTDRDRYLEEVADRIYRGLSLAGLKPAYISGERMGLSYRPPRLKLGRLSRRQLEQAEDTAGRLATAAGCTVEIRADYFNRRDWDGDGETTDVDYELAFVDEDER